MPFSTPGMYSLGTVPPTIFALELVALACLVGLEAQLDARELTRTAGLLLVRVVDLGRARECLAVGDLRGADVGFDAVRALQDVDLDVEVKLAHALEDGLARFLVDADAEGGILQRHRMQREAIFSWSALVLGSIYISMTGLGNSIFSSRTGLVRDRTASRRYGVSLRPDSATMSPV